MKQYHLQEYVDYVEPTYLTYGALLVERTRYVD